MLLPAKHIRLAESIFGLGSFVLASVSTKPKTIDLIWTEFSEINNSNKYPAYHGFDNLVLAVDFLYALRVLRMNEMGELERETP